MIEAMEDLILSYFEFQSDFACFIYNATHPKEFSDIYGAIKKLGVLSNELNKIKDIYESTLEKEE